MAGADTADDGMHYVADADEIDEGERVIVDVEGVEIAVFNVRGEFHALTNYCVHQGGPACEGLVSGTLGVDEDFELIYERDGEIVACPWHGWEFDIATGEHLADKRYRIPSHEVEVRDGGVYVEV